MKCIKCGRELHTWCFNLSLCKNYGAYIIIDFTARHRQYRREKAKED